MTGVVRAVAVSLAVHAFLAMAFAFAFVSARVEKTDVELDVSSVELSLSSEESDAPPAVTAMPIAEKERPPLPDKAQSAPQRTDEIIKAADMAPPSEVGELSIDPQELTQVETPPSVEAVSAPAPVQARVEAPPEFVKAIRPRYPDGARRRGEEGSVALEIAVSALGSVDNVKVVGSSGFKELDDAAVRAVKAARFRPARSAEGPVSAIANLTLKFVLK